MDTIQKLMPWLDDNLRDPGNERLAFPDPKGPGIARELAETWGAGDRLELLRAMIDTWGRAALFSTLDTILQDHNERYWAGLAKSGGDVSFESFRKLLWEPLVPPEFEYTSKTEGREVRFRVTRCPHADAARACGAGDIFYHLVCINDPASIRGFNPTIGFRRTATLAEGMDHCDHTYILPGDR